MATCKITGIRQNLGLVYSMNLGSILNLLSLVFFMRITTVSTLVGPSTHANSTQIRQFYYYYY